MGDGKVAVLATPPALPRPSDALKPQLIYLWEGQDIHKLPRRKLLEIVASIGGELKEVREENVSLKRMKFYRR